MDIKTDQTSPEQQNNLGYQKPQFSYCNEHPSGSLGANNCMHTC